MFEVRPRDLIWLYIFLLYVPLCLLVYRRLSPSLSPTSKRLTISMLAAQVLVLVLSLAIRPTSLFQEWLCELAPILWTAKLSNKIGYRVRVEGGAESFQSGSWFVFDQQPLRPRLPTRLWYAGLADSETWQVMLPADLPPGRYSVFTGLYRAHDQERVPARQADGTPWLDARVPIGIITIE